jgi:predicted nucleic acid-binding protein
LNFFVLDASVAVKWAIPASDEPLQSESIQLLKRYINGEINFIVPDIFWAEVSNVLWKGARVRRWSRDFAEAAAAQMNAQNFLTVSSLDLLSEALKLALFHDRPIYDCLYVALAVQCKSVLITADERLANAFAARLPVKWLGAFAI